MQKLVNVDDEIADDLDDLDQKLDADAEKDEAELDVVAERRRKQREAARKKRERGPVRLLFDEVFKHRDKPHPHHHRRHLGGLTPANSFNRRQLDIPWTRKSFRSLQKYHSAANLDRVEYMERHATLNSRGLKVSLEQVSIFLCAGDCVISFWEYSADDIGKVT